MEVILLDRIQIPLDPGAVSPKYLESNMGGDPANPCGPFENEVHYSLKNGNNQVRP